MAKSASGGCKIEELLLSGRRKEAWDHLARWYLQVRVKQAHPTREGLDEVSADRVEIYKCLPPEVLWVPLLVQPLDVNDSIPSEAEI